MRKSIFAVLMCISFLFIFSFLLIGEKERMDLREVSSVIIEEKEIVYRVILTEEGEIAVYAGKGGKEELVRKEEASPLRKNDEEILKEGIVTDNLEEALMIFEDFIS